MARKDFFPDDWPGRKDWLTNYADELANVGEVPLGFSAGRVAALTSKAEGLANKITDYLAAKAALEAKKATLDAAFTADMTDIRLGVKQIKVAPGATPEIISAFQITGEESELDEANYKPVVVPTYVPGQGVRFNWKNRGVTGLRFWCRLKGTTTWNMIGDDTKEPFFDSNPLANPNVPEEREYKARAWLGEPENLIGLDSDIVVCLCSS